MNDKTFEDILDECIDRMLAGESMEQFSLLLLSASARNLCMQFLANENLQVLDVIARSPSQKGRRSNLNKEIKCTNNITSTLWRTKATQCFTQALLMT